MNHHVPALPKRCIIVADDLTGACDCALQFRRRGKLALVHTGWDGNFDREAQVHAFSTETRNLDAVETISRMRDLARRIEAVNGGPKLVFKKIDSLMRGLPGAEIATALESFQCDVAVITPAFPELGRKVVAGQLHVEGDATWSVLEVPALLRSQGLQECHHFASGVMSDVFASGIKYISFDSAADEDLSLIAKEALQSDKKVLWVGSGGLANALAEILFGPAIGKLQRPSGTRPVLFCIGSQHPTSESQIRLLTRERHARELHAATASPTDVSDALASGKHTILRVDVAQGEAAKLRSLLLGIDRLAEAMLISGGDTVSLVSEAIGCRAIEIEDQIAPGVPWGFLRSGLLNGMKVVTKSGAFGNSDVHLKVADFFLCPQR